LTEAPEQRLHGWGILSQLASGTARAEDVIIQLSDHFGRVSAIDETGPDLKEGDVVDSGLL